MPEDKAGGNYQECVECDISGRAFKGEQQFYHALTGPKGDGPGFVVSEKAFALHFPELMPSLRRKHFFRTTLEMLVSHAPDGTQKYKEIMADDEDEIDFYW